MLTNHVLCEGYRQHFPLPASGPCTECLCGEREEHRKPIYVLFRFPLCIHLRDKVKQLEDAL